MTTFPTGAALMDARLQGQARGLGLQRAYFDLREYARARRERLDLAANRDAGVLFVHVPKCAGTTIIRQRPLAHGHRSAAFFKWRDPGLFDACFTFGFTRNPYDRLVSAFHYLRSQKTSVRDGEFGRRALGRYAGFRDFAEDLARGRTRRRVLGWVHFLPQSYYLCDARGNLLVDYAGRTETFAADLEQINARTGLGLQNARERAVPREDWRSFYTAQSARACEEIYAEDFEIFGYERLRDF
ncbi:sulfotransferase family 2 domain-containing protein [Poseidonocella sp. HB161398]|uniref:sulfotransferase family 2 domain-containing protein n=1 Tax=Poseidonocella sp. HB161398 TaxID=2320855 RepID=UPI0011080537|nr:sulfotransferase family 2 domain-containing protein [Poseidonocella sp. HB161398]